VSAVYCCGLPNRSSFTVHTAGCMRAPKPLKTSLLLYEAVMKQTSVSNPVLHGSSLSAGVHIMCVAQSSSESSFVSHAFCTSSQMKEAYCAESRPLNTANMGKGEGRGEGRGGCGFCEAIQDAVQCISCCLCFLCVSGPVLSSTSFSCPVLMSFMMVLS
jgi:hypothetical protein